MMDLAHCLHGKDSGFLAIVASLWEIKGSDIPSEGAAGREALGRMVEAMCDPETVSRVVTALPDESRHALEELAASGGMIPWPQFTRQHGQVREMGAARRDRERPHLEPISPSEVLWYRALLHRIFLDTPNGPQEFACIPSDLLPLLPEPSLPAGAPPGYAASAAERQAHISTNDRILDHACTLLAALRLGLASDSPEFLAGAWNTSAFAPTFSELQALLQAASLIEPSSRLPYPEPARRFLEMPRPAALAHLVRAWMHSAEFNELRMVPGLACEGDWKNNPLQARYAVLDLLEQIPQGTWWSLTGLIESIHHSNPDFQRHAGDYDSWFIRDTLTGEFLRGFESWHRVEGSLIRYMIGGPLHWLGLVDLAAPAADLPASAFRLSHWSRALFSGALPDGLETEDETFLVSSDARLRIPRLVPRIARYQAARFCTWEKADEEVYAYRITPASLIRARQQNLRVSHLLTLLRRSALTVPPSLARALLRWEENGVEAHLERVLVLRLRSPEMLQALRRSRAARFLGELLGPTAVVVKTSAQDKVLSVLAELGYLVDAEWVEPKTQH